MKKIIYVTLVVLSFSVITSCTEESVTPKLENASSSTGGGTGAEEVKK